MASRHAGPIITRLRLHDFRNHARLDLPVEAGPVALFGPNGAGKTNILEAISLLSPGRGLRRSPLAALARTGGSGGFAILADIEVATGPLTLATAIQPGEIQRQCRVDRTPVASANRFLDHLALLWLTPDQDALFRGPAGDRRRFLDRLVLAVDPEHGARSNRYDQALRHRNRLLDEINSAPRWLDAIEQEIAELGIAIAAARAETVSRLMALIGGESVADPPFPHAELRLDGDINAWLGEDSASRAEDRFRLALAGSRSRDRAAGRTLVGPQTSDLVVIHGPKREEAARCSTGEQKALLIGLVLAQARLVCQMRGEAPILLLDEIAAHLDTARRRALFALLAGLGGQAFMTGTDRALFDGLDGMIAMVTEGRVVIEG